jgi:hypothetical protein
MMSLRAPRWARPTATATLLACLVSTLAACTTPAPAASSKSNGVSTSAPSRSAAKTRVVVPRRTGPMPPLALLLVRAGVVRGMELDVNPSWPVFAAYRPSAPNGLAAPSNGTKLLATHLGAGTFFQPSYARDFITMSARPEPGGRT